MKKNKVFVLGMLAALLAFGLVLAGCDNPAGSNNDDDDDPAPQTYTVTFDADGGEPASQSLDIPRDGTINQVLTTPEKANSVFTGWYTERDGTTTWDFSAPVTAAMTLYAKWTPVPEGSFAVTFETNGGTPVPGQSKTSGGTIIESSAATTRSGYEFGGWYKEAAFTTKWNFTTDTVTSAIKLYAKWTAVSYNIKYDLNGGTNAASPPTSYTAEKAVTLPAPTRTGYTFGGWYDNAGLSGSAVTVIPAGSTGNKTFYARWTQISNSSVTGTYTGTGQVTTTLTVKSDYTWNMADQTQTQTQTGKYTMTSATAATLYDSTGTTPIGTAVLSGNTLTVTITGTGTFTFTKGSSSGPSGNTSQKTLVITDIPSNMRGASVLIGIFPRGTAPQQAYARTGIVAGADSNEGAVSLSGSTATALLYIPNTRNRWTGSGTYDIYLVSGGSSYYRSQDVPFNSAETRLSALAFSSVTP